MIGHTEGIVTVLSQEYSKKDVQRAGETLIVEEIWEKDNEAFRWSMRVLSNWRANHAEVLNEITETLQTAGSKVDRKAIVVKRLKRTPSIVRKLRRFNKMKLRNMQDIAGCRAIVSTTKNVYKVKRELTKSGRFKVRDYIEKPKSDGYRGMHLVCKVKNSNHGHQYPVEIQLRSKIQHSWATAVEIVDLFTKQTLKSNVGNKDWLEFFKLISHEFSKLERIDNPPIEYSLNNSLRLIKKLDIHKKFKAFAGSLNIIESHAMNVADGYNLIQIDFDDKTVEVTSFPYDKFNEATEMYLQSEKTAAQRTNLVVALVSSESIENLKEAYPNYFADSALFIEHVKQVEMSAQYERQKNPSWFLKWLNRAGLNEEI